MFTIVPSKLRLVTLIAFLLKIFNNSDKNEAKILLFLATNELVHFHYEILNMILNGDKEDDLDEQGDLQFGHLLNQSVKLLRLQGDMTHHVCIIQRSFVRRFSCVVFFRNEQTFLMNLLN